MSEVIEKKKRGRKPKSETQGLKPKIEESKPVEKKKRGRKPNALKNELTEKKEPKKRGRKPKLKYDIIDSEEKIVKPDETVILHLPIKINENDDNIDPKPFLSENIKNFKNIETNKIMIKPEFNESTNLSDPNILEEIYTKRNIEISNNNNKVNLIFVNFQESNKEMKMPETSNLCCLWDTEKFTNKPCGIPIKKIGNTYNMFGNFCSPECAAAYLFDSNVEEDELWERYSMLNYIYSNDTIKLALPRLALKKFGGPKNIDDFRKSSKEKEYDLVLPPMISVIPSLEEIVINNNYSNLKFEKHDELKLKRKNPLPEFKNSLENCMNLKYV